MILDMAALTSRASVWDDVSVVSAIAVFIGVALESVADFDILARWTRLEPFPNLRDAIAKGGLLLLIAALAVEVVAAIGSHNTNADIVAALNNELDTTIKHDIELTRFTKSLGFSNASLIRDNKAQLALLNHENSEIDALTGRSADFDRAIKAQKERVSGALSALKDDESKLTEARTEVLTNAGKAANAADLATKAQADMTTAVNAVQDLRQRMQAAITPRQIDDAHFAALVSAIAPFPKTPVDLALTRDPESGELLVRISDALIAAKWTIQAWQGSGFGLQSSARPELPALGEVTGRGVQVSISTTDQKAFGKPGDALISALRSAGIETTAFVIPDKNPDGKPNPQAVKLGAIHLVVGAKP